MHNPVDVSDASLAPAQDRHNLTCALHANTPLPSVQLIRDVLNVSEMTMGSSAPSSLGKYRAMRCSIDAVPPDSPEFQAVAALVRDR